MTSSLCTCTMYLCEMLGSSRKVVRLFEMSTFTFQKLVRDSKFSSTLIKRGFRSSNRETRSSKQGPQKHHIVLGSLAFALPPLVYRYAYCKDVDTASTRRAVEELDSPEGLYPQKGLSLQKAIKISRDLAQRIKDETGSPGLVIAVSVNGREVWSEGLGYADIENRVPCTPDTVLRIASISKSIAMAMVAKQWEAGKLDLDKPVQIYVPEFPEKTVDGEKVTITTRQLVSHLAGIRHYDKDYMKDRAKDKTASKSTSARNTSNTAESEKKRGDEPKEVNTQANPKNEMELKEYYITKHYSSVKESLSLFKDDPLVHAPGSKFLYTTHGWTLISAIVEAAAKEKFEVLLKKMLRDFGMDSTYLDENSPLIYHRGRHYIKNKNGRLVNAPYVDLSYKWAGGGLLSNVQDLVRFGNIMLYSYQCRNYSNLAGQQNGVKGEESKKLEVSGDEITQKGSSKQRLAGYLKPETVEMLWTQVDTGECSWNKDGGYGMGWAVAPEKYENGNCRHQRFYVFHTGGAIGGSSVLLILPSKLESSDCKVGKLPQGVVVAIVVNMLSVGLTKTALDIAQVFEKVTRESIEV